MKNESSKYDLEQELKAVKTLLEGLLAWVPGIISVQKPDDTVLLYNLEGGAHLGM